MDSNGEGQGGTVVPSYSTTNVQVQGVDEPDLVKTDGTYLYIIANQKVFIVKAYPAEETAVLSQITFDSDVSISNIFIYGDQLIIFGNKHQQTIPRLGDGAKIGVDSSQYWWGGSSSTLIEVYDLSDRQNPIEAQKISINGSYFDARMINNYVYVVATEYTSDIYRVLDEHNYTMNIPQITIDDETKNISAGDIYYVDIPELSDTMTHVLSIDLETNTVAEKSFMLGSSQTMYVSENNIFLASSHYPYYPVTTFDGSSSSYKEITTLHKISINTGDVTYIAQGEVPGRILNQFSMDEHDGFFRIATTVGEVTGYADTSKNNIYILDENLQRVSQIEGIAPGEKIYSARFMGDKAFLVTFKKVDPLFTIDLSDPSNPRILGELKIPGYSDYLHPYDETHIIGIGKDTVDPSSSDQNGWSGKNFAWYQGLKIALFDVSDFQNPKEEWKIVIGDRGTDSPALYDHKAFLFDQEKELLVIPVSLYEIPQTIKDQYPDSTGNIYGEFTFQGAYVYRLTLESGFEYKGRITHQPSEEMQTNSEYWYWGSSNTDITRTPYIGDVLYTISSSMVKMNGLPALEELASLKLT